MTRLKLIHRHQTSHQKEKVSLHINYANTFLGLGFLSEKQLDNIFGQASDCFAKKMAKDSWSVGQEKGLKMYGLFKQAEHGDAPSTNPKGTQKVKEYQAWCARKGMNSDAAKVEYILLMEIIDPKNFNVD